MSFRIVAAGFAFVGLAACAQDSDSVEEKQAKLASAASVEPVLVEGNPDCASLGYRYEGKFDYEGPIAPSQPVPLLGGHTATATTDDNGYTFSWTSTLPIDAVIVKAGPRANVYAYDPEASHDEGLITPNNDGGNQAQISHITFCYDFEVQVSK